MQAQSYLPTATIRQLVETLLSSGKISRTDQDQLMSALLSKASLSLEEQALVNRVFDRLKQGLLQVVD